MCAFSTAAGATRFGFFQNAKRGLVCSEIVQRAQMSTGAWRAVISESGQQVLGNLGHLERERGRGVTPFLSGCNFKQPIRFAANYVVFQPRLVPHNAEIMLQSLFSLNQDPLSLSFLQLYFPPFFYLFLNPTHTGVDFTCFKCLPHCM